MKTIITVLHACVKTFSFNHIAALPNNVDLGNNVKYKWVHNRTDKEYNYTDSKTDHNIIHEDYRLENEKLREVNQYARKARAVPPAK